jgi:hypothetical protein
VFRGSGVEGRVDMTREQTPLRISFLLYLGLAIGVLLIIVGTAFWHRNFREGSWLLALAVGLMLYFFAEGYLLCAYRS